MSVTVRIPLVLGRVTGGRTEVQVQASTVRQLVEELEASFPGMKARLCGEDGELRSTLNVFVNNKDVRFLEGPDTKLQAGDYVSIVPLIAGG